MISWQIVVAFLSKGLRKSCLCKKQISRLITSYHFHPDSMLLTDMKANVRLVIDIDKLKYCNICPASDLLMPKTLKMKLERPSWPSDSVMASKKVTFLLKVFSSTSFSRVSVPVFQDCQKFLV